jgi:hypothetical protein
MVIAFGKQSQDKLVENFNFGLAEPKLDFGGPNPLNSPT